MRGADHGSSADGTRVQLWSCNGSAAQEFALTPEGALRGLGTCLDLSGTGDHALVSLWTCTGGGDPKWTYNATTQALVNPRSGRYLDVPESTTNDGTQLQIFDCNATAAQRWTLPS